MHNPAGQFITSIGGHVFFTRDFLIVMKPLLGWFIIRYEACLGGPFPDLPNESDGV
jgi:hypothetical protein